MLKRTLPIALLPLLTACHAAPIAPALSSVELKGRVEFPGYSVMATTEDIAKDGATVSLIDTSGHARMAGITGTDGSFTLFQSTTPFSPSPGQFYYLNVTKRIDENLLTLKTVVQRTNTGWTSISGSSVLVNVFTTAVVKFDEQNGDVDLADLMNTVSGRPSQIGRVGTHSATELASYAADIQSSVENGTDPGGALVYDGNVLLNGTNAIKAVERYNVIEGNLTIQLPNDVTAFNLPNLRRVTGTISFLGPQELPAKPGYNKALKSLSGLSNLQRVGSLDISGLSALEEITNLSQLKVVDSDVKISYDPVLENLAGLAGITKIGSEIGSLIIAHNQNLVSLTTFQFKALPNDLQVVDNPSLNRLTGLESLETVGYELTIDANENLRFLTGLNGVRSVRYLTITNNANLNLFPLLPEDDSTPELGLMMFMEYIGGSLVDSEGNPNISGNGKDNPLPPTE